MKRGIVILAVLCGLLTCGCPTQAQINIGVKGGYNITQMSLGSKVLETTNRQGFFIGPVIKALLPVGIGLDIAGLYDERETELDGVGIKMKSINVPVNLRFNIGVGRIVGFYMTVGPQFSFALGDKDYTLSEAYGTIKNLRLSESFMSANMGAGLYLTRHFELGVVYNIAVEKTGDLHGYTLSDALQTHASAWQITASLYF